VLETEDDLKALQAILDRSIEAAGPFLRSSFQMPEHSLSARQLARHLQGLITVAFATATAGGAPRVAPIGAVFFRGTFWIPTVEHAARTRMLRVNPAASLSYYEGNRLAVILHGWAEVLGQGWGEFSRLEALLEEVGGQSPRRWEHGPGVFLRLEAERVYTYARHPEQVPA
jgi:hypothetical protein